MTRSNPRPKTKSDRETIFYEALSPTAGHYIYRDDALSEAARAREDELRAPSAKLTAIITLILVALVTVALAVLVARGLEAIQSAAPPMMPSDSTGSLEL